MRKYIYVAFCTLFLSFGLSQIDCLQAQTPPPEGPISFEKRSFDHQGKVLPYRILFPKNFDSSQKYPLHLFLHGAGERGDDNEAQLVHGSRLFINMNESNPAIVIFPQCPSGDSWAQVAYERNPETNEGSFQFPEESAPTWAMSAVMQLMDGEDDSIVPSRYSKIMVEALLKSGVEPSFSLYPAVNHNSWENAFAEPDLFTWIYSQQKQ